ncbi:hypothetical protein HJFPF1_00826 [Paramyrothecium foliicola]|nr:hypothetical protein HJFPF1_00826 [Paramyrothecium foliicola]
MSSYAKKRTFTRSNDGPQVDLLSAFFNLPTRSALERAEREYRHVITIKGSSGQEKTLYIVDNASSESQSSSSNSSVHDEPPSLMLRSPTLCPRSGGRSRLSSWLHRPKLAKNASRKEQKDKKLRKHNPRPFVPREIQHDLPSVQPSATSRARSSAQTYSDIDMPTSAHSTRGASPLLQNPQYTNMAPQLPQVYYQMNPTPQSMPFRPQTQPTLSSNLSHPTNGPVPPVHIDRAVGNESPMPDTLARELCHIQENMDRTRTQLAAEPEDVGLKLHLRTLQEKLNVTLDTVVAKRTANEPPGEPSSQTKKKRESSAQNLPSAGDSVEMSLSPNDSAKVGCEPPTKSDRHRMRKHSRPRQLPNNARFHICTGCGNVRSSKYHKIHPCLVDEKAVPSYCAKCRKQRLANGGPGGEHHYCFGCGHFRSKAFHEKHPLTASTRLLPNYCRKCTYELRGDAAESVDEIEVDKLETFIPPSRLVTREATGTGQQQPPTCNNTTPSTEHAQVSLASPLSEVPPSPYLPDRSHGSSTRRAQRVQTPWAPNATDPAAGESYYKRPYFEEVFSPGLQATAENCMGFCSNSVTESGTKEEKPQTTRVASEENLMSQDTTSSLCTSSPDSATRNGSVEFVSNNSLHDNANVSFDKKIYVQAEPGCSPENLDEIRSMGTSDNRRGSFQYDGNADSPSLDNSPTNPLPQCFNADFVPPSRDEGVQDSGHDRSEEDDRTHPLPQRPFQSVFAGMQSRDAGERSELKDPKGSGTGSHFRNPYSASQAGSNR